MTDASPDASTPASTPAPLHDTAELGEPSAAAYELFGDQLAAARHYAQLLASEAVVRGLIGPREVPRIWDRHLVNSALLTDLLPPMARVLDVGSGAGLPGIPMALRRPDLHVQLLEPMSRRTVFLNDAIEQLALDSRVRVVRGRAGDAALTKQLGGQEWVVARAVAPLERLVKWCLPLLRPGGTLLALKGASAAEESASFDSTARRIGIELTVEELGDSVLVEPTWVILVRRRRVRHA